MCSSDRSSLSNNLQMFAVFLLMIFSTVVPGYRYFIEHTDDLPDALGAFMMALASIIMVGDTISMAPKRKIAKQFFKQLDLIVRKSKTIHSCIYIE